MQKYNKNHRFFETDKLSGKGFTLIELLVVIAIIALLLAILMPSLRRVKAAAQQLVCMTNARSISIAANIYNIDNEALPPSRMSAASPGGPIYVNEYGREKPRWPWFLNDGIGPVINPDPYVVNPGDTFGDSDTRIMTNKSFMCPSLKSTKDLDSCDIRNGSYGYNYQYLGNTRTMNTPTGKSYLNFPVKFVSRPSGTIIIADSRGAFLKGEETHGIHAYTLDPPKLALSKNSTMFAYKSQPTLEDQHSPADGRHNGKANVSFLDGHAERMTLEEMGYVVGVDEKVIANEGNNSLFSGNMRDEN